MRPDVVLVSGVAVKRNRELLDGRWDNHDTKDAGNIADLISQGKCLFQNRKQVLKMAGLDLSADRSGKTSDVPLFEWEVWSPPRAYRRRSSIFSFASILCG